MGGSGGARVGGTGEMREGTVRKRSEEGLRKEGRGNTVLLVLK